jgi:hypothetical protein
MRRRATIAHRHASRATESVRDERAQPSLHGATVRATGSGPAGNRAVGRLVSLMTDGAPPDAQRYSVVPADQHWQGRNVDMKVSDDGKMAVRHVGLYPKGEGRRYQDFFATSDVIARAAGKLASLRSIYEIHRGAQLGESAPDGSPMYTTIVANKELGVWGEQAAAPLNCDDNTRSFLGMETLAPGDADRDQVSAEIAAKRPWRSTTTANVAATPSEWGDEVKTVAMEALTGEKGERARVKYRSMAEDEKQRRAREGINACARAGLGGAYGVFGASGRHFAPVVATSGADEVALEAHVQDQTTKGPAKDEIRPGDHRAFNPEWYFQMYGPARHALPSGEVEDQTFYGRHRSTYPHDADLIVVAFEKLPAPRTREQLASRRLALGRELVEKIAGGAATERQQLNTTKLAGFQAEIGRVLLPAQIDVESLPSALDEYPDWLLRWAGRLEDASAAIDVGLDPNTRTYLTLRLLNWARTIRRGVLSMD